MNWIEAFLLTQVVEVPLYAWLLRRRGMLWGAALGLCATAITHPIVWLSYGALQPEIGYWTFVVVAELLVWITESLLLWAAGVSRTRALVSLLLANAASFSAGMAIG